jgi:arsenate reductase
MNQGRPGMLTVYGIKSCDTCRRAMKYLAERDIEHRFHDVRDGGLDIQMLERWSERIDWHRLVNRQSLTWRKIPEADRANMTRNRAFATMIAQPTLLKRPVFEDERFFAVGFSEQRFADYLEDRT